MKTAGILLAGGTGKRFGAEKPKQFLELLGRSILSYSADVFQKTFNQNVVVVHPDWVDYARSLFSDFDFLFTTGGKTRQESVYRGLLMLEEFSPQIVSVHDGARPLVSEALVKRTLKSAKQFESGIPALPTVETLAEAEQGKLKRYIDRSKLFRLQTPQSFNFGKLLICHQKSAQKNFFSATDDSSLFAAFGNEVRFVEGDPRNLKITRPEDILLAEFFLKKS